jgi:ketosteroid isomerase-like protein
MNTHPAKKMESTVIDGAGPITAADPTRIQDEKEFRAVAIAKEKAFYAGDYDKLMSFYANDIVSVQPGTPEIVGKVAFSEGMKAYMDANTITGNLTLKEFWVSGDYAARRAEWEEVITPNDGGKPTRQVGRCFLGWKKINGQWKVITEFSNFLVLPTTEA